MTLECYKCGSRNLRVSSRVAFRPMYEDETQMFEPSDNVAVVDARYFFSGDDPTFCVECMTRGRLEEFDSEIS